MAVTSTIEYCTNRDLQDVYPHIDQFDAKRRIYNWQSTGTSNLYEAKNTGVITNLFQDGEDLESAESSTPNANKEWRYISTSDSCYYFNDATNPNSMIMEAGDDYADIEARFRRKASRLIESNLDSRMSREIKKDREGNYPQIIVHATAIQTVLLFLKAHDPTSEVIPPFQDELNELYEGLKSGNIVLSTSISADSSKGIIREVAVDAASTLRPVELRGNYIGSGYELLKVIVDSADDTIIGTATFSVYAKISTTLKNEQIIKAKTINGDYQQILGNLSIRWGAANVTTGLVKEDDEYEIELWGSALDASISSVGSIRMTRR